MLGCVELLPMSLGTKLLLSRLTLIGSVLAFGHLDMLSSFSLRLCVGVDNAVIKGEIANTFSVVFSFCDEALPTTTFSFYFLFLLYSCFGYVHWHTAVCRATCFVVRGVQVPSCGSGSRRRGEGQGGRAVPMDPGR